MVKKYELELINYDKFWYIFIQLVSKIFFHKKLVILKKPDNKLNLKLKQVPISILLKKR